MIIVHITPHFTGIFIIIVGALRIIFLKHFFCLIVGKTFLLHDTFNTIFLIRAHIHVKYIRLILQDLGCTTSQNNTGMFRQFLNNLRFRSITVTIQFMLYVRLIIYRHLQLLRQLLCDQTGSCSESSADSNYKVHRKHLLCKVLSFYDKDSEFARGMSTKASALSDTVSHLSPACCVPPPVPCLPGFCVLLFPAVLHTRCLGLPARRNPDCWLCAPARRR